VKLEDLRNKKLIGKSLEATVTIAFNDPALESSWKKYEHALPELFNVSEVTLKIVDNTGFEIIPGLSVEVSKQPKCERCWRYTEDVGQEEKYPTVCLRCAEALDAIHFAPYTTTEATA
jgi:isoleucyl-tRNA synthetase